jgi:hypothetical protein
MHDPIIRTMTAQQNTPADWIGIFAGEQLEMQIARARMAGGLSDAAAQLLQHCLPGLEAYVESQCPLEVGAELDGLSYRYGFPRTTRCPVAVSVLQIAPEHPPKSAALGGILRRLPAPSRSADTAGAPEWWQIIAAAQTGDWDLISQALASVMSGKGGNGVTGQFRDHKVPAIQPLMAVLAAGTAEESCGLVTLVGLPALELSTQRAWA